MRNPAQIRGPKKGCAVATELRRQDAYGVQVEKKTGGAIWSTFRRG